MPLGLRSRLARRGYSCHFSGYRRVPLAPSAASLAILIRQLSCLPHQLGDKQSPQRDLHDGLQDGSGIAPLLPKDGKSQDCKTMPARCFPGEMPGFSRVIRCIYDRPARLEAFAWASAG
jgi:hypothetical protein